MAGAITEMENTAKRTVVRMHQLSNTDACASRRSFPWQEMLNTGEVKPYMERSAVVVNVAVRCSAELYDAKNLPCTSEEEISARIKREQEVLNGMREELENGFGTLKFKSEKQRKIQLSDAFRICDRYARSFADRSHGIIPAVIEPRDVDLGSGLTVEQVKPTGIEFTRTAPSGQDGKPVAECMMTAYKLHASKPKITEESKFESLELFALLKYLEARVRPGHSAYLKAEVRYLKKANDRNGETPNFDPDFFNTVGGRNIVSLEEVYCAPLKEEEKPETDYDILYRKTVDGYVSGLATEECKEEDCENCELRNICKFTSAPIAEEALPTLRSINALRLTKAQREIIGFRRGVLRVLAGPGSGKTMCLTVRTVSMLDEGVSPDSVLEITFTEAAAKEMKQRVAEYNEDLAGVDLSELKCMTFNAFGAYLISLRYEQLNFTKNPGLIDDVEVYMIISSILSEHGEVAGLDYRNYEMNTQNCKGALEIVRKIFGIVKSGEDGVSYGLSDYEKVYAALGEDRRFISAGSHDKNLEAVRQIIRLYDLYDEKLREENLIEYADQETMPFELIRKDPTFLSSLGIKHLLVDEYQDSNSNNARLCRELVHMRGLESAMFVGDPAQAIYGFRGGFSENLIHLEEKLATPVRDIPLMENFRSDANICEFANKLAGYAELGLPLIVPTRPAVYPVTVKGFHTEEQEIAYVVSVIKGHLSGEIEPKVNPEDIAVLCATKFELLKMADALGAEGIDTVLLAPELLKDNSRVRAAMALIRALQDPNNKKDLMDYTFARFVSEKALGTALSRLEELTDRTDEFNEMLAEVTHELDIVRGMARSEQKEIVMDLLRLIDENNDEVYEGFIETLDRKRNLIQIADYVNSFDQFGDHVTKRRLNGFSAVSLTTAHSSKGLEWKVVISMISKFHKSKEDGAVGGAAYREKLNLLYVSETRAKERAYITGRYVAFGGVGKRIYNRFLIDTMAISGQGFDREKIEAERRQLDAENERKRKEGRSQYLDTPEGRIRKKMADAKKAQDAAGKMTEKTKTA